MSICLCGEWHRLKLLPEEAGCRRRSALSPRGRGAGFALGRAPRRRRAAERLGALPSSSRSVRTAGCTACCGATKSTNSDNDFPKEIIRSTSTIWAPTVTIYCRKKCSAIQTTRQHAAQKSQMYSLEVDDKNPQCWFTVE